MRPDDVIDIPARLERFGAYRSFVSVPPMNVRCYDEWADPDDIIDDPFDALGASYAEHTLVGIKMEWSEINGLSHPELLLECGGKLTTAELDENLPHALVAACYHAIEAIRRDDEFGEEFSAQFQDEDLHFFIFRHPGIVCLSWSAFNEWQLQGTRDEIEHDATIILPRHYDKNSVAECLPDLLELANWIATALSQMARAKNFQYRLDMPARPEVYLEKYEFADDIEFITEPDFVWIFNEFGKGLSDEDLNEAHRNLIRIVRLCMLRLSEYARICNGTKLVMSAKFHAQIQNDGSRGKMMISDDWRLVMWDGAEEPHEMRHESDVEYEIYRDQMNAVLADQGVKVVPTRKLGRESCWGLIRGDDYSFQIRSENERFERIFSRFAALDVVGSGIPDGGEKVLKFTGKAKK